MCDGRGEEERWADQACERHTLASREVLISRRQLKAAAQQQRCFCAARLFGPCNAGHPLGARCRGWQQRFASWHYENVTTLIRP